MANTEQALSFARDLEVAALKGVAPPQNWTSEAVRHIKALTAASAEAATPVAWIPLDSVAYSAKRKIRAWNWPIFTLDNSTDEERRKYHESIYDLTPVFAAPQASQPEIKASEFVLGFWIEDGRIEFASDKDFSSLKDGTYHVCTAPIIAAQTSQPVGQTAEDYLRGKYGAYRGHHAWRELEEAFNAGKASNSQPASGAGMTDTDIEAIALANGINKSTEHFGYRYYTDVGSNLFRFARSIVSAVSEKASTTAEASQIVARMPDGSTAPNVYEAFECGRLAAQNERRRNAWAELRAAVPPEVDADFDRVMGIGNADQQPAKPEISIQMTAAGMRVLQNTPEHHLHKYAAGIANSVYAAMAALSSTPAQQTEAQVNVPSGYLLAKESDLLAVKHALESCDAGDYSTGSVVHPSYDEKAVNDALNTVSIMLAAAPAPVQTEAQQSEDDETYDPRYRETAFGYHLHMAQQSEKDAERYRWAVKCDDNAEALYSFVMSHAPDIAAINRQVDDAIAKEKAK